ncbi:Anti-sigma factor [Rhodovastum atsumiense]|uniref:Anti-sigma factor n=1 Tax=Rhodovastum atsumiense TaxID=504468 RepID=A0A5M6IKU1_9PROT|nr:anti-sigma factor [Rhodovastum atsumiense]KAA5608188.1 anti-sigma factor [Rhodovastum atsumiense]CAH2602556.1 Anti-sigma factor [Rhodovastum atsumiense]
MAEACPEMRLLIQADVDGELAPAEAARIGAHVAACPGCAALQARLLVLSGRLRDELPYHTAPETLRLAVRARVAAAAPVTTARPAVPWWRLLRLSWTAPGLGFAAGFALAAGLLLVLPRGDAGLLSDSVVAGHLRALQPGHLTDVVSSDQHTVRPWFAGRLDYAPPVKDLAAAGFPLIGGRLDDLTGRPVAALVYRSGPHVIDLFVWPDAARPDQDPVAGSHLGYNVLRWRRGGMAFWAVSDLNAQELAGFARLWQEGADMP